MFNNVLGELVGILELSLQLKYPPLYSLALKKIVDSNPIFVSNYLPIYDLEVNPNVFNAGELDSALRRKFDGVILDDMLRYVREGYLASAMGRRCNLWDIRAEGNTKISDNFTIHQAEQWTSERQTLYEMGFDIHIMELLGMPEGLPVRPFPTMIFPRKEYVGRK